MARSEPSRWRQLFRHRIAEGVIIPPDVRVDPSQFSETDFPLYCPSCEYLLRGLVTERCPECGKAFDPGRLLVEQYVIEQGRRYSRRTSAYAKWTGWIGFALFFAGTIPPALLGYILDPATNTWLGNPVLAFYPLMLALVLAVLLLFTSAALSICVAVAGKKKSKQVFDAIDQSTVSFKKAQRFRWVPWAVWLMGMVAFFAWQTADAGEWDWLRYYSQRPSRLILPGGLAVGGGMIAILSARVWHWMHRR